MPYPLLPYPNHRPICPVDALPDPLRQAVLYATLKKGVPPAIALMDALAAAAAVVHVGHDCVTPDGDTMACSLYTLASAPSITGKGSSYRIFFKMFTQAMEREVAERAKPKPATPKRTKAVVLDALLEGRQSASTNKPTVEALLTESTYFALLQALNGVGTNVAIQDEDAASFFESELFKHQANRLTKLWSGDALSRAFGRSELNAVEARLSLGLRTQPDILADVPTTVLRRAIKIGLFPRFLVACHDPTRFPFNETYRADAAGEVSEGAFQARMASLALLTNARNFGGFAGRVRVELDTEARAYVLELGFRTKQWLDTEYLDIREAAGRAWEITLRVAVVLHVFCIGEGKLSRDYLERAWAIVEWSLSQHRLIFIECLGLNLGTTMTAPTAPMCEVHPTPPKPQKLPRPLQDARWLLTCLSRLWLPTKAVTVHELNLLAALPARRMASALAWLKLEHMVLLTQHGKDTFVTPIISAQAFSAIGRQS